ncbi:hypothetical protein K491DRAFT_718299 [Lophiostoma macrostomum CBS 122681]|uniref:Uncharacterized protein n=1 Tax=Lophiostoma macrostomum CBS 122681 TaxID=1314788 RepID=A0A6A6T215_9PLEO|nr:hypothetical protein K491DRAFT_718299 [Lophiostoma macrostomum CBS 122681]
MANKLCCTTDQDDRSSSPALPNARLNNVTPAKLPLLPKRQDSDGSRFTSARSEDLHELQQIFDHAEDRNSKETSPDKTPRSRFMRPSINSLHSLQKVKSVHALIKRRLSKDLSKTTPTSTPKSKSDMDRRQDVDDDTVIKVARDGPNLQLKITKSDLRKDLLSDKKPDEGGYDSDAEVLDDVAKRIAKKSPSKRTSIHSIDWKTSSPTSKQTPESAKSCKGADGSPPEPYQLKPSEMAGKTPASSRFTQFSTPNFRFKIPGSKDRKLRRSLSATSAQMPPPPSASPMRLPTLSTDDADAIDWSISIHESLRLSRFPHPPNQISPKPSMSLHERRPTDSTVVIQRSQTTRETARIGAKEANRTPYPIPRPFELHVQEPTASPRVSGSIKENAPPAEVEETKGEGAQREETEDPEEPTEDEYDARRSIHLQSMRISHHLRSGSLLSWDDLANAADLPCPPKPFRERTVSDQSRISHSAGRSRHDRHTSSSGFASSKVPSRWGKVVVQSSQHDASGMSSVYSSRPHSPPDSLEGSMQNLPMPPRPPVPARSAKPNTPDETKKHTAHSEVTPRPKKRRSIPLVEVTRMASVKDPLLPEKPLARNNSVADTKKSKFREEFSPTPPRKRSTQTLSLMKMLLPRNSLRSRSETTLKDHKPRVDGQYDEDSGSPVRRRNASHSMNSMQKEQHALGHDKEANPVWEKALKAYQDERSTLFLPKNKGLAVDASPYRERSASGAVNRTPSSASLSPTHSREGRHHSLNDLGHSAAEDTGLLRSSPTKLVTRRSALVQAKKSELGPVMEVQAAFAKQTDTKETVGAWGRYPSHTRTQRTGSAGHIDSIKTRDFALEAAIRFAKGEDEDKICPIARPKSSLSEGNRKRRKRVGSQRVAKSNSMTFGKTLLKNYTRMFRSQSTEFQRHGYGHRSSIAAGGTLEHPELEMLPDVWSGGSPRDRGRQRSRDESDESMMSGALDGGQSKGKGKERAIDSMSTLRPNAALDGGTDDDASADRARVWSVYYEDCVPAYPRVSTDIDSLALANLDGLNDLQDFGAPTPARRSFESGYRRQTLQSKTFPARIKHHSRHASHLSRASVASVVASFVSMDDAEDGAPGDAKSIVSVRKSTMDLISRYKEQEASEREKVLGLMRVESRN